MKSTQQENAMHPFSLTSASNDPYRPVCAGLDPKPATQAASAQPAYRPIEYAAFRDALAKSDSASQVVASGNTLWLVDRRYRIVAKMTRASIDHWNHVQPTRYYLPQQPCRLPLTMQLPLLARAVLRSPLSGWRQLRTLMALRAARTAGQHAAPPAAQPQWTSMRLTA